MKRRCVLGFDRDGELREQAREWRFVCGIRAGLRAAMWAWACAVRDGKVTKEKGEKMWRECWTRYERWSELKAGLEEAD